MQRLILTVRRLREVVVGHLHGTRLLVAHREVEGALGLHLAAVLHGHIGRLHIVERAAEPLASSVLKAVAPQAFMHGVVAKMVAAAVGIESGSVPFQFIGLAWRDDRMLLIDADVDILAHGVANLQLPREMDVAVSVDLWRKAFVFGQYFFLSLHIEILFD